MFKQRLLTALVLIPLVLVGIYTAPIPFLKGIVFFLILICAYEASQLVPLVSVKQRIFFSFFLSLFIFLIAEVLLSEATIHFSLGLLSFLFWILMASIIFSFPASQRVWGYRSLVMLIIAFSLFIFVFSFMKLQSLAQGRELFIYLLLLVWTADSGAYLVGKQWGGLKLIPKVSPGKTLAGFIGGFIVPLMVAIGGYYYFYPVSFLIWLGIALLVTGFSMVGDLLVSMLKRRVNIKDTGSILPGHGGILDRLDSLIAATPIFYTVLQFWSKGLWR